MTDEPFADRLELFFGNASDAVCHVYARLSLDKTQAGLELTGKLTGPECLYADTLPATIRFVDSGPGNTLLARAVLPEPCFWTPDMPHLYRATLELCEHGQVLARAERDIGIRTLGAAGRDLIYDGERWVLRAAAAGSNESNTPAASPLDLEASRENDLAMVVRCPHEALCREASRVGVLIVAELAAFDAALFTRLARHASVGMISLPASAAVDLAGKAHNVVLAAGMQADEPFEVPAWAHVVIFESNDAAQLARRMAAATVPAIALRPAQPGLDLADRRATCDALQRDLTALFNEALFNKTLSGKTNPCDPAGFIV